MTTKEQKQHSQITLTCSGFKIEPDNIPANKLVDFEFYGMKLTLRKSGITNEIDLLLREYPKGKRFEGVKIIT